MRTYVTDRQKNKRTDRQIELVTEDPPTGRAGPKTGVIVITLA